MAENKVVIKINLDKDKNHRPINVEPKTVTVWHTQRILSALGILGILVILPILWLSGDDTSDSEKHEQSTQGKLSAETNAGQQVNVANASKVVTPVSEITKQPAIKSDSASNLTKRPAAIIYDKKVIRASLNTGPKDKEPYQQVKLPVKLGQSQSMELFYFNELRNIKDRRLYHIWLKDGVAVDKKQLNISSDRAKVLSSKTMSYRDKGEWQIQLVDRKGRVFCEVSFLVIPQ